MRILLFLFFTSSFVISQEIATKGESTAALIGTSEFVLDGLLNEAIWNEALKFTDFKQESPKIGIESTEITEAYVTYDENYIYVGFKNYYQNTDDIFASVLERDQNMEVDDYVQVIIDSRNDNSNALSFQTNLLGARRDSEITENGGVFNSSWNTFWDASSSITDFGWSAEFKIPLSSLRYEEKSKNEMGFKFIRKIRSKNEVTIFPLKQWNIDKPLNNLTNSVDIEFDSLPNKSPLYVSPYVINTLSQTSNLNGAQTNYSKNTEFLSGKNYFGNSGLDRVLSNVGIDVKYKLNSSNTLDITLNTDFAQAEADDRIINLTRYSISLPEKRAFFLENAELFNSSMFDHDFFHSRRIGIENGSNVPLIGGIRLAGTTGNFEYGFLNVQSHSMEVENIDAQNFTVLRIKNKISKNESYIGGIFTNKISVENSDFNRLAAIDGFYRFGNSVTSVFFLASSFDNNMENFRNKAFGFRVNRFTRQGWGFDLRFREYQEFFNTELGFLPRPNTRRLTVRNDYRFVFRNSSWLSRLTIGNWNTFYWKSSTNQKEFFQANPFVITSFTDGSSMVLYTPFYQEDRLFDDWNFSNDIIIPKDKYIMKVWEIRYNSGKGKNYSWSFNGTIGDFYGGDQVSLSPGINYIFDKNFNVELLVDYNRLSFPISFSNSGDNVETRVLYSTKLNYFFSSEISLKAFLQYDNLSETLGSSLRLRYNPNEGTNLYIVFNQNINTQRQRFSPEKPFIDNQTLIIKYSQTFLM